MLFPAMAVLDKFGQVISSLYAPCVLSLIRINPGTSVSHGEVGGNNTLLHSKLNTVHIKSEYIAGVALTTAEGSSLNRCFE